MPDTEEGVAIEKAESHPKTSVPSSRELGQSGIATFQRFINDSKKVALAMPTRLTTYDTMMDDDAVSNSVDITNLHTVAALHGGQFKGNTEKGKIAAEFLNYQIRNITHGTWLDACVNFTTDLRYGFSLQQPVLEKRKHGVHKGRMCLKKIAPRSQHSVYGWVWDDNFREVIGIVQTPMKRQKKVSGRNKDGLTRLQAHALVEKDYTFIPIEKLLHFRHNATNNNPQGDSPLSYCYDSWQEKKIVEHLETVGATKDLAGIITLRIPSELVEAANSGTNAVAEEEYKDIQKDVADLHAGKSTSMVLLSDRDASGNYLYDVNIEGIQGGGKSFDTSNIIIEKKKQIYNIFGTAFLLLGQSNTGSNAASETGNTTHDFYVERRVRHCIDTINTQLAPRLLAANNIELGYEDMPEFVGADPTKPSLDEIGKLVQRLASTNMMTEQAINHYYEILGLPLDGIAEMFKMNEEREMSSKAGADTGGTSGATTDTQSNSALNADNAS